MHLQAYATGSNQSKPLTVLEIQGKEAHLERRTDSPFLLQQDIDKVSVVKVKVAAPQPTKGEALDLGQT